MSLFLKACLATSAFVLSAAALAATTTVESVKIEPAQIRAGDTVNIIVGGSEDTVINCAFVVHFGDGTKQGVKLTRAGSLPFTVQHKYTAAGDIKVMVEPKRVDKTFGCNGKNQVAMLKVEPAPMATTRPSGPTAGAPVTVPATPPVAVAPAPAPAKPAAPVKAAPSKPSCPEGWKLDAKSVNTKTGAYRCTSKPGTALPEGKLQCREGLGYSESKAKGQMACVP